MQAGIWKISKFRGKKERHKWAVQIMDKLIEHEANYKYSHNGGRPVDNVEQMYPERIKPPSTPPPEHDTHSSSEDTGSKSKDKQEHEDGIKLGKTFEIYVNTSSINPMHQLKNWSVV